MVEHTSVNHHRSPGVGPMQFPYLDNART
jgi:hypothetical protein